MSASWRRAWMPSWVRSWAADSAALLFSQAGAIVATSALAILLARYLGPKNWGIFSGVLGLSLALSVFVELGLTAWLLRELSQLWARDEVESEPRTARIQAGQLVLSSLAANLALGAAMIVGVRCGGGRLRGRDDEGLPAHQSRGLRRLDRGLLALWRRSSEHAAGSAGS